MALGVEVYFTRIRGFTWRVSDWWHYLMEHIGSIFIPCIYIYYVIVYRIMKALVMEECGYLWTAKQLNVLNYLLYSGFGWIQMEVFVAEREATTFAS